jgi:RNA polymerase sigma-70 factor, ECF subfamily
VTTGTLGDVLYAGSRAAEPEQSWAALVESIARGDEFALHALYERAHRIVFTLCIRIVGRREIAEELTIDVFYDLWRTAARFDNAKDTVLSWIMNHTRSRAMDRLQFEVRKKQTYGADTRGYEGWFDPDGCAEMSERPNQLHRALAILSPEERRAIETIFFAGLTRSEAAARLQQSLDNVTAQIRSGLHKLRQTLGDTSGHFVSQ